MKPPKASLKGAILSFALLAAVYNHPEILALMEKPLQAYQRGRRSTFRKRLKRAEKARCNPGQTASELASFALLSVICVVFGVGAALAIPEASALDDRIYALALSLALFFNFTLFIVRFGDYAGALSDVDRIGDFKRALRDPQKDSRSAAQTYGPANDDY